MEKTKVCLKCGIEFGLDNFGNDKRRKDGLVATCRGCLHDYNKAWREANQEREKATGRAWREANSEKKKAADKARYLNRSEREKAVSKKWREANSERAKTASKAWQKANPEQKKAADQKWQKANPERINAASRARYLVNPEPFKAATKAWRKDNLEKLRYFTQHRNARKLELSYTLTLLQWEQIKKDFNHACCYCGEELPLEQEHFIPVTSYGAYDINNIIPACRSCNSSKGSKDFAVWYPKFRNYSEAREQEILAHLGYKSGIQQKSISL